MPGATKTIHLESDSDLARAIAAAADANLGVLVEIDGLRYRLIRIETETLPGNHDRRPDHFDAKRVLNIIGRGASADETEVTLFKDQYIADAVAHSE